MTGIVPENVEPAKRALGGLEQFFKVGGLRHIAMHIADPVRPETRLERLAFLVLEVTGDDVRARLSEHLDTGQPDTARRACDDCHFSR